MSYSYYLRSVFTLMRDVRRCCFLPLYFLPGKFRPGLHTIELRNGLKFRVRDFFDIWMIKESVLDRDYERVGGRFEGARTIIDCGAGIGEFSISVAVKSPQATIHSYEPHPQSRSLLDANCALNAIGNVVIYPHAVTGKLRGTGTLHAGGKSAYSSIHSGNMAVAEISVPRKPLTEAIKDAGGHCDLLKIDCEGAEYEMLFETPQSTFENIRQIVLEWHRVAEHSPEELVKFLEKLEYVVHRVPNPVHSSIGFLYATYA